MADKPGQSSKTHSRMRLRRFPFGIIFPMMFSKNLPKGSCVSFSWNEKDDVFLTPSNQEGDFENSVFLIPEERYIALLRSCSSKHHRTNGDKRRASNTHPRMSKIHLNCGGLSWSPFALASVGFGLLMTCQQ